VIFTVKSDNMAEQTEGFFKQVAGWPAATKDYALELQSEMRRVTWPSWKQVRATTGVVIACVFAFAAYFYVVDMVIGHTITRVLTVFSKR
jgi:preprotein translocase subunit SecE